MIPDIQSIATVAASLLGSATVAAIVTKYVGGLAAQAGAVTAHYASSEILTFTASPELHQAIEAELRVLAADPQAAEATVEEAAQHVLATVAPQFPNVTITAVVNVIGKFAYAFAAGLVPPPASPTPVAK